MQRADADIAIDGVFYGAVEADGERHEVALDLSGRASGDGWSLLSVDGSDGQPFAADGEDEPFLIGAIRAALRHAQPAGRVIAVAVLAGLL